MIDQTLNFTYKRGVTITIRSMVTGLTAKLFGNYITCYGIQLYECPFVSKVDSPYE